MIALCYDLETTGLLASHLIPLDSQPEIIEFCGLLVDFETGVILDEVDTLIKPRRAISEEITKITGISDDSVKDAPSFESLAPRIKALVEGSPLVIAHNLSYDAEVLALSYERLSETVAWPKRLCTVEQTVHLKGFRLSLQGLHEHLFGSGFTGAHRARTDVEALARCVAQLFADGEI